MSDATFITRPGIYQMPSSQYHADPCPTPSLSSSGAWTLATECPAVFQYERENRTNKQVFDIGTASHLMTLEPDLFDSQIVIVRGHTKEGKPSEGYSGQDAKDQRDAAYAAGLTPLLPKELDLVRAMRMALEADPVGSVAFKDGYAEQSIFWKDQEFGIWCRTRPDWIPNHGRYLINWKTAESSNPEHIAKAIGNLGYFAKSSWEMDGFEAVKGYRPEKYCLLVQSKKPPHLVVPVWLHADDLAWGTVHNRYARGVFRWCLETGDWPGYAQMPNPAERGLYNIRLPHWAIRKFEEKELAGAFTPPAINQMEIAE